MPEKTAKGLMQHSNKTSNLVKALYEVICSNEKELKLNKEWQGVLNKDELWEI